MNNLLDIAGGLLYIAFRIILLPVFVVLDCFLGLWITAKFINRMVKALSLRLRKKPSSPPLQLKRNLAFSRAKFSGIH